MKNHIRVDGRLLQTNKTWGHLKRKQQDWILRMAHEQYDIFVEERGKLPVEGSKKRLIEEIYAIIQGRDIWIPYGEVYRVLCRRIAHWNRQHQNNDGIGAHDQIEENLDNQDKATPEQSDNS